MRRAGAAALAGTALVVACGKSRGTERAWPDPSTLVSAPSATAPGAPRPGMLWIPSGVLRAGSGVDEVPRVADAELPGVEVPLGGFYVDVLAWPNEPGAIATTDVTRDDAKRLCESKAKRLCSELEWERACKGPDHTRYEYGSAYDARVCGAGAHPESSSQRPSGQRPGCRSGFGARDMHGGVSEWTDSRWGRGAAHDLGVVRGGNDVAGELVTRCAFARPRPPGERSAATGFRCCAGPRNDAEVDLEVTSGPPFEFAAQATRPSPPLDALDGTACGPPRLPAPCSVSRAWTWRPAPNVELTLSGGCVGWDPNARCALAISRAIGERTQTLAQIDTGREIPEVVLVESQDRRVRVRGADAHRQFFRELIYNYGQVDVKPVR